MIRRAKSERKCFNWSSYEILRLSQTNDAQKTRTAISNNANDAAENHAHENADQSAVRLRTARLSGRQYVDESTGRLAREIVCNSLSMVLRLRSIIQALQADVCFQDTANRSAKSTLGSSLRRSVPYRAPADHTLVVVHNQKDAAILSAWEDVQVFLVSR